MVLVAACGGSSEVERGDIGGLCYPNGTCNVGLACVDGKCVAADAPTPPIDAPSIDAPSIVCADDSALEPNDTLGTAFDTMIDSQRLDIAFAALAICPVTDKDHYRVTLSAANANKAIEVIASWTVGPGVAMSILNAGGTSIANATPMATNAVRACVPNMPAGSYYPVVSASVQSNYGLSIKILASCN